MSTPLWKSLIPESKHGAVDTALQQTFGTTSVESIVLLTGGLSSALVYRIIIADKSYVLRLVMRIDEITDPVRQYACMNAAAEAGIAPRVYYASTENAVSITAFIEPNYSPERFDSPEARLLELVRMIQSIHSLPFFPKLVNFMDSVDGFIQRFQSAGQFPDHATAEHFRYYAEIQKVYPRHDTDLVSSHNDLNPNNILTDSVRLWVVDWETAFLNDRYVDLANVANFAVKDEAQEKFYLSAYFGDSLNDYKRARFFLMQQICRMFYAMIFLYVASTQRTPDSVHDTSMDTIPLPEFYAQLAAKQVSLSSYEGKLLYGKLLLNEALRQMKTLRFAACIREVVSPSAP